jgi:hypothetical protein
LDDWKGKVDVSTARPKWNSISRKEKQINQTDINIDAVTGATS